MSSLALLDQYYEHYLHLDNKAQSVFLNDLGETKPEIQLQILQLLHDEEADNFFATIEKEVANSFQGKCHATGDLIGNYCLQEIVGSGGMSFVYRATRTDGLFQRDSAIKIVRKGLDSKKMIQLFKKECKISAQLNHKNITRVYDGGITKEGLPYLVMEYIDGLNIVEYCKHNKLDLKQRLQLFHQICEAIHYCHEKGIIHCDIKPSNILVNAKGEVKLTDFGISRFVNEHVNSNQQLDNLKMLTAEYASPELKKGEAVNPSSDIYQLGLLLYELTTWEKAYDNDVKNVFFDLDKIGVAPLKNLLLHCIHQHADSRIDIEILLATLKQIISLIEKKNQVTNRSMYIFVPFFHLLIYRIGRKFPKAEPPLN